MSHANKKFHKSLEFYKSQRMAPIVPFMSVQTPSKQKQTQISNILDNLISEAKADIVAPAVGFINKMLNTSHLASSFIDGVSSSFETKVESMEKDFQKFIEELPSPVTQNPLDNVSDTSSIMGDGEIDLAELNFSSSLPPASPTNQLKDNSTTIHDKLKSANTGSIKKRIAKAAPTLPKKWK